MNIGMFSDTYLPDINGVVISLSILENELERLGHHVYIFTTSKHIAQQGKSNVFKLPSLPLITNKEYRMASVVSKKLEKAICDLNIEIIHTHTEFLTWTFARRMADKYNIKMVHTYHTMWEDYTHYLPFQKFIGCNRLKKLARNIIKRCGSHSIALIAPTEKTKKYLVRECLFNADKIHVIPSGIDLERFKRQKYNETELSALRSSLGFKPQDKILTFVGRIAKEKSIDVLITGMQSLIETNPEFAMLIVGFGPAEEELMELAEELGISGRIKFTGRIEYERIGLYYNIGDAFIMASTSETQGITYIEAMAAGLPVIAKFDSCLEDLITDNENGVFFYENSSFQEAVLRVFNNTGLNARIREGATSTAERYSRENYGSEIEKVYLSMLQNKEDKTQNREERDANMLKL